MTLLLLLVAIWVLAYFRAKLPVWTVTIAAILLLGAFVGGRPIRMTWLIVFVIFLIGAIIANVPALRIRLFTQKMFFRFRSMLPPISRTEREALEAGTVWWDGELFSGNPAWERLLSLPPAKLTEEEEAFLAGPVEELCRMLDDWKIVEDLHDLPKEAWQFIRERGFFGMIIPKEYGGLGFSTLAHSEVVLKLASRCYTAAISVMVPNSLGPAELLLHYGTETQRDYYLPRLAKGEEVPCFALTGPEAGSDAASIPDTGIVCRGMYHGEECLGILLNWEKRYITLGPVATVIGLAFRLFDPDHLIGDTGEPGITLALVPAGTPGITVDRRHNPLGIPFHNGPMTGKDVFVPIDFIIGGKAGVGQGWRMLMEGLAAGRSISLPALSTGGAKLVARAVGAYAGVRRQFRMPIGRFEGIEEVLARIAATTYLMDSARITTCSAIDSGERPSVVSSIVKYHSTERMRTVVNDGMDVMGGYAISLGPRNVVARQYQAAPIGVTVEGANILTRSMIIFGQGVIRCHPCIRREMQAIADPDEARGIIEFDRLLCSHIALTLSHAARSLFHGLTGSIFARAPEGPVRRYFQAGTRLSAAFALTADIALMTLGGELKRREKISGRLADILGHLYMMSALLKRYYDRGWSSAELPLVIWGCDDSLLKIQESFVALLRNFPSRPAAWFLTFLTFPLGRAFYGPSDTIGHEAARILQEPGEARDALTAGIFLSKTGAEPLLQLDGALATVIDGDAVEIKLRQAVKEGKIKKAPDQQMVDAALEAGVITAEDAERLVAAVEARRKVTRVDDFPLSGNRGSESAAVTHLPQS